MHQYVVRETAQALVAATAETIVQIVTPATRRAQIVRWGCSFNGITATDVPVTVELCRQTTAGTASAFTPLTVDPADPAALVTAQRAFTAEPTTTDILESHYVTPVGGLLVVEYAFENRPVLAVSTRMGIRCTAPTSAVSTNVWLVWQE